MNIPDETKLYEAVHRVLKSGSTIAIDDGVQGGIGPVLYPTPWARIIGVSSTIGQVTMPLIGLYCSSKWAFEAIRESLAMEVKAFGIKVSIVEPRLGDLVRWSGGWEVSWRSGWAYTEGIVLPPGAWIRPT